MPVPSASWQAFRRSIMSEKWLIVQKIYLAFLLSRDGFPSCINHENHLVSKCLVNSSGIITSPDSALLSGTFHPLRNRRYHDGACDADCSRARRLRRTLRTRTIRSTLTRASLRRRRRLRRRNALQIGFFSPTLPARGDLTLTGRRYLLRSAQ